MAISKNLILVIDDSQTAIYDAKEKFESKGHEIAAATTGSEGLQLVKDLKPSLVLCDVHLGKKLGTDTLKDIKDYDADLPVIIITAKGSESIATEALRAKANDYITKPLDLKSDYNRFRSNIERYEAIKENRQLQEDLEDSKDYVENIFRTMLDCLLIINTDGTVQEVNNTMLDLIEDTENNIVNKNVGGILVSEDGSCVFKKENIDKILETGELRDQSLLLKTKTKTTGTIPVHFSASVMKGKKGKILGIVGVAKDMREINKLMENEKNRADEFEKLNEKIKLNQAQLIQTAKLASLGEMVTGLAHELNNPLQYVNGYAEQILISLKKDKESLDKKRVKTCIKELLGGAGRMNKIISNFRDFARTGNTILEPTSIKKSIAKAHSLVESQLRLASVHLEQKFPKKDVLFLGEATKFEQVLVNLFVNARDAMEGITERKTLSVQFSKKNGLAKIKVTDCGHGIDNEHLDKIFDPFHTTKEVGKGTGLGLSVSHGIIQSFKGELKVERNTKKGVTFTIILPVHEHQ